MAWLDAAITAHIQVVAPLRGHQAKILPLRFRTLADAARDIRLDFMWGADALVTVFQADGEADRILHAVATPRSPDTALDRPQGLAIGMAAFKANGDQFLPDVRQILDLRPQQIDALSACNLGVEAILIGCFAQRNALVG